LFVINHYQISSSLNIDQAKLDLKENNIYSLMLGYIMSALIDLFIERQYKAKKKHMEKKKQLLLFLFLLPLFFRYESVTMPPTLVETLDDD